ncbi:hypothetical protein IG631_11431 [Alternaria alternata]|nr:hypothetical protein IG631_11431 [Alternaria alternata]
MAFLEHLSLTRPGASGDLCAQPSSSENSHVRTLDNVSRKQPLKAGHCVEDRTIVEGRYFEHHLSNQNFPTNRGILECGLAPIFRRIQLSWCGLNCRCSDECVEDIPIFTTLSSVRSAYVEGNK